jgi:hypothetical protein
MAVPLMPPPTIIRSNLRFSAINVCECEFEGKNTNNILCKIRKDKCQWFILKMSLGSNHRMTMGKNRRTMRKQEVTMRKQKIALIKQ